MGTATVVPVQHRSVVLVTPDAELRQRLAEQLRSSRWDVYSAAGGAEAMVHLSALSPEAMIVDHWLPDLEVAEFAEFAAAQCPGTDMLGMDGGPGNSRVRSARRNELLHALREAQGSAQSVESSPRITVDAEEPAVLPLHQAPARDAADAADVQMHLPELVGDAPAVREMARQVRLVAPHPASVLILGETGTGKELVARAVHRLSPRAGKPFVVLNCAAIPEHLLEAELFGHTRGAFTGAVTSRTGRMEAAHGGTLFLDEIGEMPLPLQAKMLRFLENGEIQKVGENDSMRVDVRIVAATHQPLEQHAEAQRFRLDLFHRLAVFPVDIPPLRDRREDIPMLVEHLLRRLGETMPRKSMSAEALSTLMAYGWPGNVRELGHAVQRGAILCGEEPVIRSEHIRLHGRSQASRPL